MSTVVGNDLLRHVFAGSAVEKFIDGVTRVLSTLAETEDWLNLMAYVSLLLQYPSVYVTDIFPQVPGAPPTVRSSQAVLLDLSTHDNDV